MFVHREAFDRAQIKLFVVDGSQPEAKQVRFYPLLLVHKAEIYSGLSHYTVVRHQYLE